MVLANLSSSRVATKCPCLQSLPRGSDTATIPCGTNVLLYRSGHPLPMHLCDSFRATRRSTFSSFYASSCRTLIDTAFSPWRSGVSIMRSAQCPTYTTFRPDASVANRCLPCMLTYKFARVFLISSGAAGALHASLLPKSILHAICTLALPVPSLLGSRRGQAVTELFGHGRLDSSAHRVQPHQPQLKLSRCVRHYINSPTCRMAILR